MLKGRGHVVELLHGDITAEILGAAFEVHRELGPGFLESIYEEALVTELQLRGFELQRQLEVPIYYKSALIGKHRLDLVVEGRIVVELKAIKDIDDIHKAIVQSYLKATNLSVAIILNFAKTSLQHKRLVRTAT
jgi:GxxExxY protein